MTDYTGKTVIISGNSNGTGFDMGMRYANAGANILFFLSKDESYDHYLLEQLKSKNTKIALHQVAFNDVSVSATTLALQIN